MLVSMLTSLQDATMNKKSTVTHLSVVTTETSFSLNEGLESSKGRGVLWLSRIAELPPVRSKVKVKLSLRLTN
jgi:hypothetical protein